MTFNLQIIDSKHVVKPKNVVDEKKVKQFEAALHLVSFYFHLWDGPSTTEGKSTELISCSKEADDNFFKNNTEY